MKQFFLEFYQLQNYINEDFIVTISNLEAYNSIKNYESWPQRRILVLGEGGSGKTHLCHIWQKLSNAKFFDGDLISCLSSTNNIIIDGIENYSNEEIFHLINHAAAQNKFLLMTGQSLKPFYLADLTSRINATAKILIKTPDEELLRIIIAKQLTDKQLKFDPEVIDYIIPRLDRSFNQVNELIGKIEREVAQSKSRITVRSMSVIMQDFHPEKHINDNYTQ
jgi:chromosomal replication initiation ATPase DnaA